MLAELGLTLGGSEVKGDELTFYAKSSYSHIIHIKQQHRTL